ncbi:MAG: hypothetical protein CL930_16035 [Deltaproteobacteria bacterium]|nr:hypothetical protein [Deltaproteobacteria bacterium]
MSWDRTWGFKKRGLKLNDVTQAATAIAGNYAEVKVTVEKESDDCITCFFETPIEEGSEHTHTLEVSIYDMGSSGHVISLEADAADNDAAWDDASQLTEDLADAFEANPLEL